MDRDEFEHFGIKGMKWGVRKKRSSSASKDYTEARALSKKKLSELSNAELQKLNQRMQLEQNYSNLQSSAKRGKLSLKKYTDTLNTANNAINATKNTLKFVNNALAVIGPLAAAYMAYRRSGGGGAAASMLKQIGR